MSMKPGATVSPFASMVRVRVRLAEVADGRDLAGANTDIRPTALRSGAIDDGAALATTRSNGCCCACRVASEHTNSSVKRQAACSSI